MKIVSLNIELDIELFYVTMAPGDLTEKITTCIYTEHITVLTN